MDHINDMLNVVSDKLESLGSSDVAVGEPVKLGPFTILALARSAVGFGGGGGEGEGIGPMHGHARKKHPHFKGKGSGGGAGGGVKVRPVGVVVLGPDGVQVLPVPDKQGVIDKLFDKVPELVDKVKDIFPDHKDK